MRVWGLMRGDLAFAFRVRGDCRWMTIEIDLDAVQQEVVEHRTTPTMPQQYYQSQGKGQ